MTFWARHCLNLRHTKLFILIHLISLVGLGGIKFFMDFIEPGLIAGYKETAPLMNGLYPEKWIDQNEVGSFCFLRI